MNSSGPVNLPLATFDEPEAVDLARALLAEHDGAIRRLCFVGLAERAGVHLLVAAREQGLASRVSRGASGQMTIVLEAPPTRRAALPRRPARTGLAARCRWLLRRVAGRG